MPKIAERTPFPIDPRVRCLDCRLQLVRFGAEIPRHFNVLEVRPPELGHDMWLTTEGVQPLCQADYMLDVRAQS